jgi:outer membrane receptor protein involved in Fe transport
MEKFGLIYASGAFTGSLQGSYTGRVQRRATDVGSQPLPLEGSVIDMDNYRPNSVSPFFTLNSKLTYAFTRQFSASLVATNLLNKSYFLDKTLAFPFDYQGAQRNVSVVLKVNL